MQYILDANVLITANRSYYEIDRIPHFWDWIAKQAAKDIIGIPEEMMREITPDKRYNSFLIWLANNRSSLSLEREQIQPHLSTVFRRGYGIDISDQTSAGFSESNANDAVLVAYALADRLNRKVVTLESVQRTGDQLPIPRRRKIPLVCRQLSVECIDTFQLIRELDFRIPLSPNIGDTNATS